MQKMNNMVLKILVMFNKLSIYYYSKKYVKYIEMGELILRFQEINSIPLNIIKY